MEAAVRWSPHSTGDRKRFLLVDVANSSLTLNEVDDLDGPRVSFRKIAYHGKLPSFGAFDWSKTIESIVAIGHVSGNAALIKLTEGNSPSEVAATFRIKQQRKCNSISFSSTNWLAVALDKTRSDVCLNVWDAGCESPSFNEPIRRLCAAELVSSVRFFPQRPQEVVLGAQRSYIRVYDLRDPQASIAANLQASTKNVNNITIDPLDENCFASAGTTDDPAVTVWDKRWMSQSSGGSNSGAVFEFRPAVESSTRTTVWSLRFSGLQRGRLALCSSTGELKVIDTAEGRISSTQSSEYMPSNPYGGASWTSNRYVSQSRSLEHPLHHPRHGRPHKDRVIAFDWIPNHVLDVEQGILTLRPDRQVDVLSVPSSKMNVDITAKHELSLGSQELCLTPARPRDGSRGSGTKGAAPLRKSTLSESLKEGRPNEMRVSRENSLSDTLALGMIHKERCQQGYLFDCEKNMEIVSGNWHLERLWEIVGRFQRQAADAKLVYEGLDISYLGVSDLWSERLGNSPNRRLSGSQADIGDALIGLNERHDIPPFEGARTDFPENRQACLAVCGWKFSIESLEEECQELIEKGLLYQAIVQAVLHDCKHIALNLLRSLIRGKTITHNGLAALLAADELNAAQREMCLWMAADSDDPALKALLTFLSNGDWRDVMKTNYLHLGYRVALGLKYLNDTELSGFISTETARAIRNGDLEGILLTGLGQQSMDVLQTYIARTNDLQTAVLAAGFTNPLYVDDVRWKMWKEVYFQQLQSWQAFNERSKFRIQHGHLSRTREGRALLDQPPAQVKLLCTYCQSPLAKHDSRFLHGKPPPEVKAKHTKQPKAKGPAAHVGTVCLKCGRHLPRCAVCMLWLGTLDPRKRGGAKELATMRDLMGRMASLCRACGHGYCAGHAAEWFARNRACAVPDCDCACKEVS